MNKDQLIQLALREGTLEIKEYSRQAKIEEIVAREDMLDWALTETPKQLAPDIQPKKEKLPLVAIYSFARSCMP